MKNKNVRLMCISAVFVALVFVITAYLQIPTNNGFIHVGDGFIYLAACILPWPYAIAVGVGGAVLADVLTGYAVWAPGSMIIKALIVCVFSNKGKRIVNRRNLLALIPAAAICAVGYYLYEAFMYGNFVAPITGILASLTQSAASSVCFILLGLAIDKIDFKSKMLGGF